MPNNWTKNQIQAINKSGSNLLVAAAAGSGKTAVLVQRIVNKIINEKIDIDRLLIVTFTNAAATEMRERILNEIYKKLDENPDDLHLQKQLVLLNKSNISTIHSFCLEVIRNNFFKIDVSPNFRLAEGAEIELLQMEVLEDLFDSFYDEEDKDFLKLIETYCSYRDDDSLKNLVLKIYKFTQSTPFPEEWLVEQTEKYNINDFSNTSWCKILIDNFKEQVAMAINTLKNTLRNLKRYDELYKFQQVLEDDITMLEEMLNCSGWDEVYYAVNDSKFKKWPIDKKIVLEAKDIAKQTRDTVKDNLKAVFKIFETDEKQAKDDIDFLYNMLNSITKVVNLFSYKFKEAKKEKNIIDFNDVEHFALELLLEKNEKKVYEPTDIAKMYQEKFIEIAVDEYQDVSLVQEKILNSISNGKNIFMVGDIKQSIYKFRHARPELFKEKYETYDENKIQLYDNFRSREEILNLTNEVFKTIMSNKLGDVEYENQEFLRLGAEYPEPDTNQKTFIKPELNIIDLKVDIEDEETEEIILENAEIEAKFVANKIKEILDKGYFVYDKKLGYRRASFRDIVILLRTTANVSAIYEKELTNLEYPVFSDTTSNYFESIEIQIVLLLLKIIDNPINDIALVSVLRSPICNFTDNDLIEIRTINNGKNFYDAILEYDNAKNQELTLKIRYFLNLLEDLKEKQEYLSLDELIWYIYEKTGFYNYVSLMPNGDIRLANLKMLFEKAKDYEQGLFKGLYNFINYIDRLNKLGSDMGAPKLLGENDDVIRIMSIHKSKGLEFPIVFLCGTGKQFNFMDLNEKLLLHQDLGFGMQYIDYDRKIEYSTLTKEAIKIKMREEILSEEMRLLYVALTRAREQLIITGLEKDLEKSLKEKKEILENQKPVEKINKGVLKKAKSYLDWLELINIHNKDFKSFIDINYCNKNIEQREEKANLEIDLNDKSVETSKETKDLLDFEYYYKDLSKIESKTSVSKISKEEGLKGNALRTPKLLEAKGRLSNAEKGTVMHLVMQKIDYRESYTKEKIVALLEELRYKNIITDLEKEAVDIDKILTYTKTDIFKRIAKAKHVYRENPFYINIPASMIYDIQWEENILVQGIIDLYFIDENDKIVLVDYKTDYIKSDETELIEKYKKQLNLYKQAIEEALKKQVDETHIYSLYLNKLIKIN